MKRVMPPIGKVSIAIDGFRAVMDKYLYTSGATYVHQLVKALAPNPNVERIVILVPHDVASTNRATLENEEKVSFISANIPYSPASGFWAQTKWIQAALPNLLSQNRHAIDAFIAPYHYTPILRPKNIFAATVVHDVCGLGHGYPKTKFAFYRHLAMLLTASIFADAIIPISDFTRQEFLARFPWAKARMNNPVYNGIDDEVLDSETVGRSLAGLDLFPKQYFFGMAAAHPRKGTDLLLESYIRYRESGGTKKLVILGGAANQGLIYTSLPDHLHETAVLLPRIPDAIRNALYGGAIALVFPSRCEGFGYPILEAMRQGCPAIAARDSPAREIVGATLPLLERLDPAEIAGLMDHWEAMGDLSDGTKACEIIARSQDFGESFGDSFFSALRR